MKNYKVKPCLRCDKKIKVTPEWRLCITCRQTINREDNTLPIEDSKENNKPIYLNDLDKWRNL